MIRDFASLSPVLRGGYYSISSKEEGTPQNSPKVHWILLDGYLSAGPYCSNAVTNREMCTCISSSANQTGGLSNCCFNTL